MLVRPLMLLVGLVAMPAMLACKNNADAASGSAVAVMVGKDGFQPSSVTFKKGTPGATLIFTRTSDETCATEVVFPELNIKKDLPKGKPVPIEIPTDTERKLTFQCGMAMYKSSVVIN